MDEPLPPTLVELVRKYHENCEAFFASPGDAALLARRAQLAVHASELLLSGSGGIPTGAILGQIMQPRDFASLVVDGGGSLLMEHIYNALAAAAAPRKASGFHAAAAAWSDGVWSADGVYRDAPPSLSHLRALIAATQAHSGFSPDQIKMLRTVVADVVGADIAAALNPPPPTGVAALFPSGLLGAALLGPPFAAAEHALRDVPHLETLRFAYADVADRLAVPRVGLSRVWEVVAELFKVAEAGGRGRLTVSRWVAAMVARSALPDLIRERDATFFGRQQMGAVLAPAAIAAGAAIKVLEPALVKIATAAPDTRHAIVEGAAAACVGALPPRFDTRQGAIPGAGGPEFWGDLLGAAIGAADVVVPTAVMQYDSCLQQILRAPQMFAHGYLTPQGAAGVRHLLVSTSAALHPDILAGAAAAHDAAAALLLAHCGGAGPSRSFGAPPGGGAPPVHLVRAMARWVYATSIGARLGAVDVGRVGSVVKPATVVVLSLCASVPAPPSPSRPGGEPVPMLPVAEMGRCVTALAAGLAQSGAPGLGDAMVAGGLGVYESADSPIGVMDSLSAAQSQLLGALVVAAGSFQSVVNFDIDRAEADVAHFASDAVKLFRRCMLRHIYRPSLNALLLGRAVGGSSAFAGFVAHCATKASYYLEDARERLLDVAKADAIRSMPPAEQAKLVPSDKERVLAHGKAQSRAGAGFMHSALDYLETLLHLLSLSPAAAAGDDSPQASVLTSAPAVGAAAERFDAAEAAAAARAAAGVFRDPDVVRPMAVMFASFIANFAPGPRSQRLAGLIDTRELRYDPPGTLLMVLRSATSLHLALPPGGGGESFAAMMCAASDFDLALLRSAVTDVLGRRFGTAQLVAAVESLTAACAAIAAPAAAPTATGAVAIPPLPAWLPADPTVAEYEAAVAPLRVRWVEALTPGYAFERNLEAMTRASPKYMSEVAKQQERLGEHEARPDVAVFLRILEATPGAFKLVVTGPSGTPYAAGAFEFDVFLPSDFPAVPPMVSFRTTSKGTVRFNFNLYNDGKVCLSLINQWHAGSVSEKWVPGSSSLEQLALAIYGMILVPDPLYTEPGNEDLRGTPAGAARSREYNATIRLHTMRTAITANMLAPPPEFADVYRAHFYTMRGSIVRQAHRWVVEAPPDLQGVYVKEFGELVAAAAALTPPPPPPPAMEE